MGEVLDGWSVKNSALVLGIPSRIVIVDRSSTVLTRPGGIGSMNA